MSLYGFETMQGMFKGTNFEVLTITTAAATGFTAAVYGSKPLRAFVTVEGSSCRYRYDGTAPTVTTGHVMDSGGIAAFLGLKNLQNFLCISTSGGTTTLTVTYENDIR